MALYRITNRTTGEAWVRSTGGMDPATEALSILAWQESCDIEELDRWVNVTPTGARSVDCPTCGETAGRVCTTPDGAQSTGHIARSRAYRAKSF